MGWFSCSIQCHVDILLNWLRLKKKKKMDFSVFKFNSMSLKINPFQWVLWVYSLRGGRNQRHCYSLTTLPGYSTSSEEFTPLERIRGFLSSLRIPIITFKRIASLKKTQNIGRKWGRRKGNKTKRRRKNRRCRREWSPHFRDIISPAPSGRRNILYSYSSQARDKGTSFQ